MTTMIEVTYHDTIAELTLNRPEAFNAFNLEMVTGMADSLIKLAADERTRGVAITSNGKAFCAGGDLKWAIDYADSPGASFHKLASQFHLAVLEIRRMMKPVVAAVNGIAAGGGFSLALACDFRVMGKSAVLKQAYTSAGLCVDGGGTFTLPRMVGVARATEIIAFDENISSDQALAWGLATRVVEDGSAREETLDLLNQLAQRSVHSFGQSKRLFNISYGNSFESQIELERDGLSICSDHPDGQEGLKAFAQKRKPKFYAN